MNYITYDEFQKMDMRIGLIRFVEPVEDTEKLLRCEIDFGPLVLTNNEDSEIPFNKKEYIGRDIRQIVSGIREFWPKYKELEDNYGLYILNLKPRKIRGVMSHGMLMAVDGVDLNPVFLVPQSDVLPGTRVR